MKENHPQPLLGKEGTNVTLDPELFHHEAYGKLRVTGL